MSVLTMTESMALRLLFRQETSQPTGQIRRALMSDSNEIATDGTDRDLEEALDLICEARGALNETSSLNLPKNVEQFLDDAHIEVTKAKESVKHFSEEDANA